MQKAVWIYFAALAIFLLPIALFHKDLINGLQKNPLFSSRKKVAQEKVQNAPSPSLQNTPAKKEKLPPFKEDSFTPYKSPVEIPEIDSRKNLLVLAIEKALPSVVNIGTERLASRKFFFTGNDPLQRLFEDFLRTQENTKNFSLGSGFLIHRSGLIVTNSHVVDRASKIHVTLSDGSTKESRIIAQDTASDIALLQLLHPPKLLPCSSFDLSGNLFLGETVIAAGNPFGLASSISAGILSGTKRHFSYGGRVIFSDILQTDAIVYPGNSGGPLINIKGEVIGMNMSLYENAPGIGFAIPADRILEHLANWMIPERIQSLSLGLIPGIKKGKNGKYILYIKEIISGSPAENANLKKGEVIIKVDGKTFTNPLALNKRLVTLKRNETFSIMLHSGKEYILAPRRFRSADASSLCKLFLSLSLSPLTENIASFLHLPVKSGLLVNDILPATPSGIRRGDLLVMLNGKRITSLNDLFQVLSAGKAGERMSGIFLSPVRKESKQKKKEPLSMLQYRTYLPFN